MVNIEIVKIQLTGIIGCIKKYTSEPTIISIIESLNEALSENSQMQNNYRYYCIFFNLKQPLKSQLLTDADLENLLNKFHQVVIQLRDRHDNRNTLDVTDEYDVQDLLHSLLKIYCDDIRREEWTPSYAGTASRQDFLLKKEKIVIEIKKTRKGLNNKELANELIIDIARYKTHPDCQKLICFVYDPENRIKNPRGFETDLSTSTGDLNVKVYIRP